MASAGRTFRTEVVKKVVEIPTITLTLSEREALALKLLTGSVTGSNEFRHIMDAVYHALGDADIDTREVAMFNHFPNFDGGNITLDVDSTG